MSRSIPAHGTARPPPCEPFEAIDGLGEFVADHRQVVCRPEVAQVVDTLGKAPPAALSAVAVLWLRMASTRTRIIGTTRLEAPVAQGGMAEVYRGEQKTLGRRVAVKVMLPDLAKKRDMVKRFRREARALANLRHENIVAIHDLVEKNNQHFMIMEYVDGIDLHELLKGGKGAPLDVALLVAAGVARALEHAHFRRVIHRDIKPSNIMVSLGGDVKLADFGLAKDLSVDDLTQAGIVLGTPSYIAPEFLKGARATQHSDIYALGVVLYECISGTRPFRGETTTQLFAAIAKGDRPRLRTVAPDCPRAVEKIVDRCMDNDPDKRWGRVSELRKELEQQLNRLLKGSPSARMVAYLYDRGYATPDHLATLDIAQLTEADPSIELSLADIVPVNDVEELETDEESNAEETFTGTGRRILLAVAVLLAIGGLTAYSLELRWTDDLLAPARSWLEP
ncbi:MAG: serine/threonine protein kinase [Myxococcales bacterium]|nr:serine/threonine protein kinase [Myxococcales bacterium]